jgi:hypothetical protein
MLPTYGKVAVLGVVGNEDGAHHVTAEVFQALNDVGFTIPAAGGTYWVGEAMQKINYDQAGPKPDTTGAATKTIAAKRRPPRPAAEEQPIPALLNSGQWRNAAGHRGAANRPF